MSFGTSETYIYAYIAFASVYLIASFTFVASALRVSTGMAKSSRTMAAAENRARTSVPAVIGHGQKIIDYTQLSTLLPLVYIVGSMFLGSVISRDADLARTVNIVWVAFTGICGASSVLLAVLGIRETSSIGHDDLDGLPEKTPEPVQRLGMRLGVSSALLLLVAVFTALNLVSIILSLDALNTVDFLL